MKNKMITLLAVAFCIASFTGKNFELRIQKEITVDSLGACQGISYQNGKIYLYGDRETGVIRQYNLQGDSLINQHQEYKLTVNEKDVINHPTGIAFHQNEPVFIGNSIRLNPEGTRWKAVIYCVNWLGLQQTKTLDGNIIQTIDDDACIQGTRPEYVQYEGKWWVATADYGDKKNEVRLHDPEILKSSGKTSAKGVLYKKFDCGPWVQNLFWIAQTRTLVLIQNQAQGKKWRFTFVDLEKSLKSGRQEVLKVVETAREDELEGFAYLDNLQKAIAVTSAKSKNVNILVTK